VKKKKISGTTKSWKLRKCDNYGLKIRKYRRYKEKFLCWNCYKKNFHIFKKKGRNFFTLDKALKKEYFISGIKRKIKRGEKIYHTLTGNISGIPQILIGHKVKFSLEKENGKKS